MTHVFISYSRKDKEKVSQLAQLLRDEGFEVWIDDRIDYGTAWPEVIAANIESCSAFLLVMSENSKKSGWVLNELAFAKMADKKVFPVLLNGKIWLDVAATQMLNLTDGSLPTEKFYGQLAGFSPRNKTTSTYNNTSEPFRRPVISKKPKLKISTIKITTPIKIFAGVFALIVVLIIAGISSGMIVKQLYSTSYAPTITNMMTTNSRLNGSVISAFNPDDQIFITFDTTNITPGTKFTSRWYYKFMGSYILISKLDYSRLSAYEQIQNIYFEINNFGIPGDYVVDIYKGDTLIGRKYFVISSQ